MKKIIEISGVEYPAEWGICSRCHGDGDVANPVYDGLSTGGEFMQENPEFLGEYLEGKYNIVCPECKGTGKVLVPSTDEGFQAYQEMLDEERDYREEREAEMRAEQAGARACGYY